MTTKVLLDTDIGSDIDDAVCLAYLLAHPDCELLGITTVTGEAEQRARMASALCRVAGKDIPIFPGAEQPLTVPGDANLPPRPWQPYAPQAEALTRWPHATDFPSGQAVNFMRETIRAHPGEVTLLTIGPLTNAALLFALDPQIPALLKSLVMMGGVFTNRLAGVGPLEWNAMLDPAATALVYQRGRTVKQHRSVGLDVTCQVTMPSDEIRRRFRSPLLQPVLDFAEVWFKSVDKITFHDPLAAVTIFDETVCAFERGQVEVELFSPRLAGLTYWQADPDGVYEAALAVSPERFFQSYFKVFED